jgi:hypothetical protein
MIMNNQLKGFGKIVRALIEVLSRHLHVGAEEDHEKPQSG